MAKIKEEIIIVKVSKLVKDHHGEDSDVFSNEVISTLEEAIGAMVGEGHIVEIIRGDD